MSDIAALVAAFRQMDHVYATVLLDTFGHPAYAYLAPLVIIRLLTTWITAYYAILSLNFAEMPHAMLQLVHHVLQIALPDTAFRQAFAHLALLVIMRWIIIQVHVTHVLTIEIVALVPVIQLQEVASATALLGMALQMVHALHAH